MATALIAMVAFCGCSRSQVKRSRPYDYFGKLETALGMFEVDLGRYPTSAEGLKALIEKPGGIATANWHGPYIEPGELKDQWGHEFVYRGPGTYNTKTYDLFSMGPDGKSQTDGDDPDDIANWQKNLK